MCLLAICMSSLEKDRFRSAPFLMDLSEEVARIYRTIHKRYSKDWCGVDAHLEPDILEYGVKWALGSITTNEASGGDGIPAELFQILKDDTVTVLYSVCQQIWKTQQWPQYWKRSVFIPVPKRAVLKNVQTTGQLCSFPVLVRLCSKSFKLGFHST